MSGCGPSSQATYQFLSLEMCTFNSDAKITGTEIVKKKSFFLLIAKLFFFLQLHLMAGFCILFLSELFLGVHPLTSIPTA